MWYDSKIVLHSISPLKLEAITYEVTIPKWIVAEFNTHKAEIERNSASSRAVPTNKIVSMIVSEPCLPVDWRYDEPGMGSTLVMDNEDSEVMTQFWLECRDEIVSRIQNLKLPSGRKPDKQRINRLLEPWMWTKIVVTFTLGGGIGFNNFMALRDAPEAQPEFATVAAIMHDQYHSSEPITRRFHFPYTTYKDWNDVSNYLERLASNITPVTYMDVYRNVGLISAARCGRVTHYRQGEEYNLEKEINRGNSFFVNGHFSPLRHPLVEGEPKWYGNQYGWIPISKLLTPTGVDYRTICCELGRGPSSSVKRL